jgi:predicted Zn-dependent protease
MRAFKHIVLYFGFFALMVFIFSQLDFFSKERVQKLSSDQEERISRYLTDVFVRAGNIMDDEAIVTFVDSLSSRLLSTIDEPKYDYSIYVIRNRTVNAFALPGGNIVLHSGLLDYAESPEEVAAVLAHEFGHSEKGHIMQKLMKEIGFGVLFSALTGGDIGVFSEIGRKFITTRFDREYELEADGFALETLEAASIDPRYLAVFFHRLSESDDNIMIRIDFISTHPSHDARRQKALSYQTAEDFEERPIEGINWELVKALSRR